jgi:hypothetical protein
VLVNRWLQISFGNEYLRSKNGGCLTNCQLKTETMTPAEINEKWAKLQEQIAKDFDSDKPDIKVILFLIGVQELGQGPRKFSKRQKEELMHIATCRLFSEMGFYELEGLDQDGWPHWKLVKQIPNYTLLEQEMVMKSLIIDYFEQIN